jgi:hypothetical protein
MPSLHAGLSEPEADPAPSFRAEGWMHLPALIPAERLAQLRRDVLDAPSRRVTVGNSGEKWSQYKVTPDTSLGRFLAGEKVRALAQSAVDVPLRPSPSMWAQAYRTGERIAWHCDNDGEVQFLLCIEAPPESQGGVFCMRVTSGEVHLCLRPGDAVLFRASRILHSTTRLVELRGYSAPLRITAVARFHAKTRAETSGAEET